ncbi:MAG: PHP-associated domain-containing protein [Promethearchaeota archaeon]
MHVHSTYSPCSRASIQAILDKALDIGLQGVAITDHDTIKGAQKARELAEAYGVQVFIGSEVTSSDGQILAYGIEQEIPPGLTADETIRVIHSLNGVAVAAHPFRETSYSLGNKIFELELDGVEVSNPYRGIDKEAKSAAEIMGVSMIGGSDAHHQEYVGWGVTEFKIPVKDDLTLLKAIRNGECRPLILKK